MMESSGCFLATILVAILACLGGLFLVPVGIETAPVQEPAVSSPQLTATMIITQATATQAALATSQANASPTPTP